MCLGVLFYYKSVTILEKKKKKEEKKNFKTAGYKVFKWTKICGSHSYVLVIYEI